MQVDTTQIHSHGPNATLTCFGFKRSRCTQPPLTPSRAEVAAGEQGVPAVAAQAYLIFWGQKQQWSESLAEPAWLLHRLEGAWQEVQEVKQQTVSKTSPCKGAWEMRWPFAATTLLRSPWARLPL